jgi:hypothetical protein
MEDGQGCCDESGVMKELIPAGPRPEEETKLEITQSSPTRLLNHKSDPRLSDSNEIL